MQKRNLKGYVFLGVALPNFSFKNVSDQSAKGFILLKDEVNPLNFQNEKINFAVNGEQVLTDFPGYFFQPLQINNIIVPVNIPANAELNITGSGFGAGVNYRPILYFDNPSDIIIGNNKFGNKNVNNTFGIGRSNSFAAGISSFTYEVQRGRGNIKFISIKSTTPAGAGNVLDATFDFIVDGKAIFEGVPVMLFSEDIGGTFAPSVYSGYFPVDIGGGSNIEVRMNNATANAVILDIAEIYTEKFYGVE